MENLDAALANAKLERMETGRWFASVPECPGAWATGDTPEAAKKELRSVLEGWIEIKTCKN